MITAILLSSAFAAYLCDESTGACKLHAAGGTQQQAHCRATCKKSTLSSRPKAAAPTTTTTTTPTTPTTTTRPHLIFVMVDARGYYEAGFRGNALARTPFMDGMIASDALLIERHYSYVCSLATCTSLAFYLPSRSSSVWFPPTPPPYCSVLVCCKPPPTNDQVHVLLPSATLIPYGPLAAARRPDQHPGRAHRLPHGDARRAAGRRGLRNGAQRQVARGVLRHEADPARPRFRDLAGVPVRRRPLDAAQLREGVQVRPRRELDRPVGH